MNGYAPNPSMQKNESYAPLTASLLARKGEAMPAVDADAHAGVDIDMRPARPANNPGAAQDLRQGAVESLQTHETYSARPHMGSTDNVRTFRPRPAQAAGAWTVITPTSAKARLRLRAARQETPADARKATVTFRMPAHDFVRLRFASRELAVACQTIILEALECYLEANDVPCVCEEDIKREMERLARLQKNRKQPRA